MPKTVTLGERSVVLPRFNVFKGTEVGALVAQIMEEYPELVARAEVFQREYAEKNATVIDRATAEWRYEEDAKRVSPEGWEASGNQIRLPGVPSGEEIFMAVFPQAYQLARGKVLQLLALMICENSKLKEADLQGLPIYPPETGDKTQCALGDAYVTLVHETELQQVVGLIMAAKELLAEQFAEIPDAYKDDVGKLLSLIPGQATIESSPPSNGAETSGTDSPAPTRASAESNSSTKRRTAKPSKSPTT
jgi:hypothetical protein